MGASKPVPVRRFEMGCSAIGGDDFLKNCGYVVMTAGGGMYRVGHGKGKPKTMRQAALVDLLDQERLKRGLEPIRRRP